ncbi:MAG: nucleotide exchange factor GrpE [Clostridia bacterium]|nr:nucleotide exchange factor GrpE [Clostridia bacterium]
MNEENVNEVSSAENNEAEEKETNKVSKKEKKEASELEKTKLQLAEMSDKYLRVLAEYDNFRKRTIKERDGIYGDAYVDCIKNLLPVIDNIERILTLDGEPQFVEGVRLIVKQMHETLNKMGVQEIECKTFDLNLHNAVMHIDDEAYGENEIVEVFQKGYTYGGKVIRYAMVKVAN